MTRSEGVGWNRIGAMKSLWKWVLALVVLAAAVYGVRKLLDET